MSVARQSHTPRTVYGPAVRVLVVGPVDACGGMAHITRMTNDGFRADQLDIATCNTAKDTPPDRSTLAACLSHMRRTMRLVRMIWVHRPQVVHLHTCSYNTFWRTVLDCLLCNALRKPYVLHVHGGMFDEFLESLSGRKRALACRSLQRAARVIVLGQIWKRRIARSVPACRLQVIPNVVQPSPPVERPGQRGRGILFVGDLSEVKRPEDLIVSYASLPAEIQARCTLTIVGAGSASRQRQLQELANRFEIGDRVIFAGRLPHNATRDLMRCADLLVLPSRAEGMPLVLLEAMHAELPCVVTRVGAVPEMVDDGVEACIVPPKDPLALTRALMQLLNDDRRRRSIGLAARERVQRDFTVARFRDAIAGVWLDVARTAQTAVAPPIPRLAAPTFRSLL